MLLRFWELEVQNQGVRGVVSLFQFLVVLAPIGVPWLGVLSLQSLPLCLHGLFSLFLSSLLLMRTQSLDFESRVISS
jgi:hypothetical protein